MSSILSARMGADRYSADCFIRALIGGFELSEQ